MVLEEASSLGMPPEDSIGSGQTPGQGGGVNYTLDLEKCARPFVIIPGASNMLQQTLARSVAHTVQYAENTRHLLQRPLTQEETQAVAEHLFQKNATTMNGLQLGIYWGAWRAWSTRKNFNWPVIDPYKKNPDFNPRKFLIFEGQQAIRIRHGARAFVWVAWGMMVAHFLADTYSSIRGVRNLVQDDRLQAINIRRRQESQSRVQAQRGQLHGNSSATTPKPTGEGYSDSSTTTSGFYGGESQGPVRQAERWPTIRPTAEVSDDDASPTGGLGLWEEEHDSASGGSAWDRLRQQSASTAPKGGSNSTAKTGSSEADWVSQEASSQQPQQKGGAWDRIRQQNQQEVPQQQQKNDEDSWWK